MTSCCAGEAGGDCYPSPLDVGLGKAAWHAVHNHGEYLRDFPNDNYFEQVAFAIREHLRKEDGGD